MVESSVCSFAHFHHVTRECPYSSTSSKGGTASHWFCAAAYLDECIHNPSLYYFQRRKVQEEAPANLIRLVELGRISLNAVEGSLPRLSAEDKQRIDSMADDDVEAEVERLTKQSATSKRRMEHATAKKPHAATTPPAIEVGANADDDDHDNRTIGAKAVSRALDRSDKKPDTPERKAFLSALECLPLSDAAWACDVASSVEQETREIENAVPVEEARSRRSQR